MPIIRGFGSEWDARSRQTKFWIELDNGAGYAGFGAELPAARLDLQAQLEELGLPLAGLGAYGLEITGDITAWQRQLARFPGGRAAQPAFDLARLMRSGAEITVEFAEGPLQGVTSVECVGYLALPSGQIFAGDPFPGQPGPAFLGDVPPATYPVYVAWAEIPDEPRRRSVVAWIAFDNAAVIARWEQALTRDQDPATLTPGQSFGCPVDSGCACFADATLALAAATDLVGPQEACQPAPHLVVFTTGWGDGNYACYWGLDSHQSLVVLAMDLDLITYVKN